jgi:hypothetical protein
MAKNYRSDVVLNSIAASAADLVVQDGRISVNNTATTANPFLPMDTIGLKVASGETLESGTYRKGILKYLLESGYIASVSYSVNSLTTYTMIIGQQVGDNYISETISYPSDSNATDAEIAAALVAQINASQLRITATGSATPITLTADASYPLFNIQYTSNLTAVTGMPTYAPNATEADAITAVIAPHATAGTAIAGTTTVTVTTAAAHLLVPGDIVTLASVATMTLSYMNSANKVVTGAAGGTFRVATVPTSTTFTLEGVTATGTNSGTITITAVNCCFVQTAAAQATIDAGKQLTITGVATATLDGGTEGTYRVGAVLSGDQRFKLENAALVGTNSGTIVIRLKESESRGLGSVLTASIPALGSSDNYDYIDLVGNNSVEPFLLNFARKVVSSQRLWINTSDTDYVDFEYALLKAIEGVNTFTPNIANPEIAASLA